MNTRPPIALNPTICLQSVSKSFSSRNGLAQWLRRDKTIAVLSDISLRAGRGEVVVLMGPNGSGKSTLLKLVAAALLPETGRVAVLGFETGDQPMEVRRRVGLAVAQERSFFPRLTAYENLSFFAALDNVSRRQREERLAWVLEQSGLNALRDRFVHQFSSGMYQRLAIARALLKQPAVLLLDEPTRSADPETGQLLRRLVLTLALQGTTVLLTTHSFEEAAMLADTAMFLSQGRIADCLHRPGLGQLRSAYASVSASTNSAQETMWEACSR